MDLIDIKQRNITADDLDSLAGQLGSYEALFNKRAQKFKALSNGTIELTDKDYRAHILDEYTFLKRPVFIFDDAIFVGNSPSEIEKLKNYLSTKQ
jgi:arsenate reductase